MMAASNHHASSVFANSCISTPRNPKTHLPADHRERLGNSHKLSRKSVSDPHQSRFHGHSLMSSARIQNFVSAETELPTRPHTAPAPTFTIESPDTGSLDYPALFSTLLESNTLLREEIHQLQQEHGRTFFEGQEHVDACSSPRTSLASLDHETNDSLREMEGNYRSQTPSDDIKLSHSLPPRLLKNTWMQSESPLSGRNEQERLTSSSQHDESASSILSRDSSGHNEGRDFQSEEELVDVEMLSDAASAHSIPLDTSTVSISTLQSSDSERVKSGGDPFASPGVLAIERMWEDFSVEDYAAYEPSPDEPKKSKQWSPCITIPDPFSMTLRDETTPKKKSKSMLIAEREKLEREAREQAELKKQFRATPVPASTYLPLYELINAKNRQRREDVKRLTKEMLTSTERPFQFMKREEKKKQLKAKLLRQSQEMAKAREQFKARPFPRQVFDPKIDEEVYEQEEYRRIRIRMRAEELLAASKLPGNMQVKGREYTIGAMKKKRLEENQDRAFLTQEHKFHPHVNAEVPDYDQAYLDFQRELARRKKSKQTTTTEPFYLRTQLIPSRKKQIEEDIQRDMEVQTETRWPYLAPRTKLSGKPTTHHIRSKSTPSYPAQMTETAHIRQSMTQERLASAIEKQVAEEDWRREKKERDKALQRMVSQRSLSHDPTAWLEERKRQKLQQFRKLDKERKEKYQQELEQIKQKVDSRPLLFELSTLAAARQSAEAKYIAALRGAGFSDENIQAMNQEHGGAREVEGY